MPQIKLLDQHTINKIAAGEVVERPAAVVKELVENAIDAGASAITVEIKEGGISFIRITDNGVGIPKKDIQTAFIRHSTSKIKSIEDLMIVSSLGFRGEALASIAAVSQIEVITKTYDDITGVRYVIEGGEEVAIEEIGCPEGTTIIIKNLFYNTPARRKFLKKPATEGAHISDFVNKLALGHMGISFKFIYNNAIKLHTSGNNVLRDCILNVYDKDIVKNMIDLDVKGAEFHVEGFIGKPRVSRANRTYETYYINGRYVKSKLIMKAIEEGYRSKLMVHKYPFVVLHMTINPDLIDVNVHPTKMEIRFHNEVEIYEIIKQGIEQRLKRMDLIPEVSFTKQRSASSDKSYDKSIPEPFERKRREQYSGNQGIKHTPSDVKQTVYNESQPEKHIEIETLNSKSSNKGTVENHTKQVEEHKAQYTQDKPDDEVTKEVIMKPSQKISTVAPVQYRHNATLTNQQVLHQMESTKASVASDGSVEQEGGLCDTTFIDKKTVKSHKIIGQLFNTYWIVELEGKFYFIDQHAAHERVLYERIMGELEETGVMSQGLLQPIIVHVNMKEIQLIKTYSDVFDDLGFEIEEFGKDAYAIRSVPYIFTKSLSASQFIEILDSLNDHYSRNKLDMVLHDIATMACKAAVKAHDKLSVLEYEKLFDELLTLENPYTCPHGRPTIISMTQYELEKKFKRIQ